MIQVNCNLCGRNDWRIRFPSTLNADGNLDVDVFRCTSLDYGNHAQIVQCRNCDLVYANPRWSTAELEAAYAAVEDEVYVTERAGRELTFQRHLQALEKRAGPANGRSLLDVGAYIGVFVEVAAAAGWDACGVEPSNWAVAQAQERNLPVIQGTQDTQELEHNFFDVLTLWDVIEHVSDPAAELRQSFKLLKPGGWLAVHTMDIGSLTARIMGSHWPWLMDMHLYYFSRKTLTNMLKGAGFDVIWSGTQGRYLRIGYLASRLAGINRHLGRLANAVCRVLNLHEIAIPINTGDLFTVYARRPE